MKVIGSANEGAVEMTKNGAAIDYGNRIQRCEREIKTYREDVAAWKSAHQKVERCWACEDLVAKADYLNGRILSIDSDYRDFVYDHPSNYSPAQDELIRQLAADWTELSTEILTEATSSHDEFGVQGFEELRHKVEEMRNILAPDDEVFEGEYLDDLSVQAIEEQQKGSTRPLLPLD